MAVKGRTGRLPLGERQQRGNWYLAATLFTLLAACTPDPPATHPPVVGSISVNPATVNTSGTVSLGVTASDPDGGSLSYSWSASAGTFNTTAAANVTWTAPGQAGNVSFKVRVTDDQGLAAEQTAMATVTLADLQVPSFNATAQQGKVSLAWQNPTDGRFSQVLIRASDTATPSGLADGLEIYKGTAIAIDHTTYNGSALVAGKTYFYSIWVVYNDSAFSSLRVSTSATPTAVPTVPVAPANVQVTVNSSTSVTVTWAQGSANTDAYIVERMVGGGSFVSVGAQLPSTQSSLTDSGLSPATTYTYRIIAKNGVGNSVPSVPAAGTTQAAASAPGAPTSLVSSGLSASSVTLTWTDNANNETTYKVSRLINGSNEQVFSLGANATSYTDSTISADVVYTYVVRAANGAGDSLGSNQVTIDTRPPTVPGGLVASSTSTNVTLAWTDATSETTYSLERATASGGPWSLVSSVIAAGSTQYADSGLATGVTYYYRLKAVNLFASSTYATASAQTGLPTGVWNTHNWDSALWGN